MRYPGKELDGAALPSGAVGDVVCALWSEGWELSLRVDPGEVVSGF